MMGCQAKIIDNNWFEILQKHLKYNAHIVLDIHDKSFEVL